MLFFAIFLLVSTEFSNGLVVEVEVPQYVTISIYSLFHRYFKWPGGWSQSSPIRHSGIRYQTALQVWLGRSNSLQPQMVQGRQSVLPVHPCQQATKNHIHSPRRSSWRKSKIYPLLHEVWFPSVFETKPVIYRLLSSADS